MAFSRKVDGSFVMTKWTEARLNRLYSLYNEKYWDGSLSRFEVKIGKPSQSAVGLCDLDARTIVLDLRAHRTDSEIRGTLLHEMAHGLGPGSITVERGRRDFASGDRVMFLKNDQCLRIKNGSLGIVETVDADRMTVRLDAGRSVAFDLKDYAHLDHGYATTIHKAQGMTVDRAHVLATPGLDRHAAYVALSRHRESVQLHYGRDDFADDAKLVRFLSRDRSKDMASDYERNCEAPGRSKTEPVRKGPERRPELERRNEPGIFASFRPITVSPNRLAPTRTGEPVAARDLDDAVRRYARSLLNIAKMRQLALPILPEGGQFAFLAKPFTLKQLVAAVKETMAP